MALPCSGLCLGAPLCDLIKFTVGGNSLRVGTDRWLWPEAPRCLCIFWCCKMSSISCLLVPYMRQSEVSTTAYLRPPFARGMIVSSKLRASGVDCASCSPVLPGNQAAGSLSWTSRYTVKKMWLSGAGAADMLPKPEFINGDCSELVCTETKIMVLTVGPGTALTMSAPRAVYTPPGKAEPKFLLATPTGKVSEANSLLAAVQAPCGISALTCYCFHR